MNAHLVPDFTAMLPDEIIVWVHIPEFPDQVDFTTAVKLARERSQAAATEMELGAESQLRIEEAAKLEADLAILRGRKAEREQQILRELGY